MRHPSFHSPSEINIFSGVARKENTIIYTSMFPLEPSESAILWIYWSKVNILYSQSFTSACRSKSYSWFCVTEDKNYVVCPLSDLLTWKISNVKHSEFSFFWHLEELWDLRDLAHMCQCIALSLCVCIYIHIYGQQNCRKLYLRENSKQIIFDFVFQLAYFYSLVLDFKL